MSCYVILAGRRVLLSVSDNGKEFACSSCGVFYCGGVERVCRKR